MRSVGSHAATLLAGLGLGLGAVAVANQPTAHTSATDARVVRELRSIGRKIDKTNASLRGGLVSNETVGDSTAKIADLLDEPGVLSYGGPKIGEYLFNICLNTKPADAGATRC